MNEGTTDRLFEMPGCEHEKSTLGKSVASDGSARVWRRCDECGENTAGPGQWLPHDAIGNALAGLPTFADAYRVARPPCVRCGTFGTQLHHFFPRGVARAAGFDDWECELWPTAWLCQNCHSLWHKLVDRQGV